MHRKLAKMSLLIALVSVVTPWQIASATHRPGNKPTNKRIVTLEGGQRVATVQGTTHDGKISYVIAGSFKALVGENRNAQLEELDDGRARVLKTLLEARRDKLDLKGEITVHKYGIMTGPFEE